MDKKNLSLLLVPLVLGACHYHDGYERARVYPVPVAYRANYPVYKPVKPKPVKVHKRPIAKKHKVYRNSYDTQNRTYLDRYAAPQRPVPIGAWQGRPLREPQMPGYSAR